MIFQARVILALEPSAQWTQPQRVTYGHTVQRTGVQCVPQTCARKSCQECHSEGAKRPARDARNLGLEMLRPAARASA